MVDYTQLFRTLEPRQSRRCMCNDCKKKRRKAYLQNKYRKTHPKYIGMNEKVYELLLVHARTMEELSGICKTNHNTVRVALSTLRKRGLKIKKTGSYYRILKINN
jgi:hypothetical protein